MRSLAVRIDIMCNGEDMGGGSGTVVGYNRVVTAHHVVAGMESLHRTDCGLQIVTNNGKRFVANEIKSSADDDLSLLNIAGIVTTNQMYAASDIIEGTPVYAVGWPAQALAGERGRLFSVTKGVVASLNVGKYYRVTSQFYKGSSGGPIFTEDGRLVGICIGMTVSAMNDIPFEGQYGIMPVERVNALLAD